MWMMGCNDDGEICLSTNNDSFSSGRKLRPLIPRPPPSNPATNSPDHNNHHGHMHHHGRLNHSHGLGIRDPDRGFFPLNQHHLATMTEQSKREFQAAHHQVVVSSRWNPTPEQLQALEDLYKHGTRTPSADQIQQITSQLRRYGKIEGKNVFYWFQNHKARERQKRRRQMETFGRSDDENGYPNNHRELGNIECKESGGSRKTVSDDDDVQRANNNSNNINTPTIINNKGNVNNSYNWGCAEGSNIDRGGKSAMAAAAVVGGGGSASGSSSAAAAAAAVRTTSKPSASSTAVATSLWMKLNESSELLLPTPNITIPDDDYDEDFVLARNVTCPRLVRLPTTSTTADLMVTTPLPSTPPRPLPCPNQDFQTLQLFPLRSEEEGYDEGYDKEMDRVDFAGGCHVGEEDHLRRQFYEFLPMKN